MKNEEVEAVYALVFNNFEIFYWLVVSELGMVWLGLVFTRVKKGRNVGEKRVVFMKLNRLRRELGLQGLILRQRSQLPL